MAPKLKQMEANFFIPLLILFVTHSLVVTCDDMVPIPPSKDDLTRWFQNNVKPFSDRRTTLDPALIAAEGGARTIRVRKDGKGGFKTVTDAVNSIPSGNTKRVVIDIGPGNYTEKIKVDNRKPFVTFYGDPQNMPRLVYGGTASEYGTFNSATLIIESDYFVAANIVIVNSAARPDGKRKGAQAVALRLTGDKAAIYNSKMYGFQDTLYDHYGKHFFKDCYIEGTVDFICGDATSIYLNSELHVIPGDNVAFITAQARTSDSDHGGYSFVHCKVTGTGGIAFLGRPWMPYARVVYSYTNMTDVVHPQGWSDHRINENDKTIFFGEYQCTGAGANNKTRIGLAKKLTYADVKPYLVLGYVQASTWLLPPPQLNELKSASR